MRDCRALGLEQPVMCRACATDGHRTWVPFCPPSLSNPSAVHPERRCLARGGSTTSTARSRSVTRSRQQRVWQWHQEVNDAGVDGGRPATRWVRSIGSGWPHDAVACYRPVGGVSKPPLHRPPNKIDSCPPHSNKKSVGPERCHALRQACTVAWLIVLGRRPPYACRTVRLHCRWHACGPRCAVRSSSVPSGVEAEPRFDLRVGRRRAG
jgi:hypothetical protein